MDKDEITVIDSTYRPATSDADKKAAEKNSELKLKRAAEKEQQLLERKGLTDVFINGIFKIKELFQKKQNTIAKQKADKQK